MAEQQQQQQHSPMSTEAVMDLIPRPAQEYEEGYYFRPVILSFEVGSESVKTMTVKNTPLSTVARICHYNSPFIIAACQKVLYHRQCPGRHCSLEWDDLLINMSFDSDFGRINLNDVHWTDHVDVAAKQPLFIRIRISTPPTSAAKEIEIAREQRGMYDMMAQDKTSLEELWDEYAMNPNFHPKVIFDRRGKTCWPSNTDLTKPMIPHPRIAIYPLQGIGTLTTTKSRDIPLSVRGITLNPSFVGIL